MTKDEKRINKEWKRGGLMKTPRIIQKVLQYMRCKLFKLLPETVVKMEFRRHTGYSLNLKNPKTYNEKIQWMKLYWYDEKACKCADKYSVREYVESKGLKGILNDVYGVFDSPEEINFDKLPDKFVLKTTHGCGQNLVCTDKTKVNWESEKRRIKHWLKRSQYFYSFEWVYRDIKPRLIIERLIETEDGLPPKSYKIFCFNGKPRCIYVQIDYDNMLTEIDFYDLQWNRLEVKHKEANSKKAMEKPKELGELLTYARILSEDFPHVRVDFYIEEGRIFFGECTFFHYSGMGEFHPRDFDYKLGEYLKLPKI